MHLIAAKRDSFRKEIRHRELQQYFATKRRLMMGEMEVEKHSFRSAFEQVVQGRDVEENLMILSGLSFEKEVRQECGSDEQAEQLYVEMIQYLLQHMGEYRLSSSSDSSRRIKCLNIILNLLADRHCPNTLLAPPLCDFILCFYESVGNWGFDKELVEVGCLLANLCNNDRFVGEAEEGSIGFVLGWFQELLHVREEYEMTESIYSALVRMVHGLQRRYKLTNTQLPQLYQSQVLNILQVTLFNEDYFGSTGVGYHVYSFVEQMVPLLLARCPQEWTFRLVRSIFSLLGTLKKELFSCLCRTLKRMLTLSNMEAGERVLEVRNGVRMLIVDNFMGKLIIYLTMLSLDSKEKVLDIVVRLIGCDRTNAPYFLEKFVKEAHLENWMIRSFSIGNEELNLLIFQLVAIAEDLGLGEYFSGFLRRAQSQRVRQA